MSALRLNLWVVLLVAGGAAASVQADAPRERTTSGWPLPLVFNGRWAPRMPGHPEVLPGAYPAPDFSSGLTDLLADSDAIAVQGGVVQDAAKAAPLTARQKVAARHHAKPRMAGPAWKYTPRKSWKYTPKKSWKYTPKKSWTYTPKRSWRYTPKRSFKYTPRH